jgi:hypothetical protein
LSVFQSVVYFTPIYLIGIMCSIRKNGLYNRLSGKEVYLAIFVIILATVQAVSGNVGSYHKKPFEFGGIDFMLLQKIFMCLFFMIWLNKFEKYRTAIIDKLAATSFAIFFIHPILIWTTFHSPILDALRANSWFVYVILVSLVIFICMSIALIIKKITPEKSRYIVGY